MARRPWPYGQTSALLLESLRPRGEFAQVVQAVVDLAVSRGLYELVPEGERRGAGTSVKQKLHRPDNNDVPEFIRQLMWQLLVQGVLVFGQSEGRHSWPYYRLTSHGEKVVGRQRPQPYDPTGFLDHFHATIPAADPVIVEYVEEAVRAFNHDCLKSASVMMGAASEKAVLLLCERFGAAIDNSAEKQTFQKSLAKKKTISEKYRLLQDRLARVVSANPSLPHKVAGVAKDLPDLVRLVRL